MREHGKCRDAADEQIHRFRAIEQLDQPRKRRPRQPPVRRALDRDHARGTKHQPRQIHHGQPRGFGSVPLRKHHREVQQERRQEREGDGVAPVEDPVETIEGTVEREREDAEERDAEPEEMQRRLIARAAQPHRRAHHQREEPHRGEHEIHRAAARRRRERHFQALPRAEPQEGVREARAFVAAMLILDDVGGR